MGAARILSFVGWIESTEVCVITVYACLAWYLRVAPHLYICVELQTHEATIGCKTGTHLAGPAWIASLVFSDLTLSLQNTVNIRARWL